MTTIFWAGDSTVKQNSILTYPQTGIGQMFERYVRYGEVLIDNRAENGRSTKQFIDEGRLEAIRGSLREGDFLFIQFGHNDEKDNDPARYADPQTDFPANLELFIGTARSKGAIPVLITPLTRLAFRDPNAAYRHDRWAQAMRDTAERTGTALVDLTAMSERLVDEMGSEARTQLFMHIPSGVYPAFPDGMKDGTHLQPLGAMVFGGLIARRLYELGGVYRRLLCQDFEQWLCRDAAFTERMQHEGEDERV